MEFLAEDSNQQKFWRDKVSHLGQNQARACNTKIEYIKIHGGQMTYT